MSYTAARTLLHSAGLAAGATVATQLSRQSDGSRRCKLAPRLPFALIAPCSGQRNAFCSEEPLAHSKTKRVCCIGAGAAGLACAKELIERGFETTVFEAREGMGGVWRIDKTGQHVGVRLEQKATSSKYYLGFSDYPIPDSAPDFVSHEHYISYLEDYSKHFHINNHINFGHSIVGARQLVGGGWEVDVVAGRKSKTLQFDAIAVCSGLHTVPDFPPKGAPTPPAGFKARVVHARELKDARNALRGKRIVVVGGGETGAELAHVAGDVGSKPALMALRRGMTVIGPYLPLPLADRIPDARTPPVDLNERRVLSLLPHPLKNFIFTRDKESIFALRDQNPGKHSVVHLLDRVAGAMTSLVIVPFFIMGNVAADVFKELTHPLFWTVDKQSFRQPNGPEMSKEMKLATSLPSLPPVRLQRNTEQLYEYTRRATWFRMQGYTTWHYQQVRSLLEEFSGARHTQNFLTKSDDFIYNLMDHSLELRPGIAGYEGTNTVVFEDRSRAEIDIVVWCTGYQPQVPFLSQLLGESGRSTNGTRRQLDGTEFFKNVFHPQFGDSLAFIGFARPQLGAMPPIAEIQARWFGAVLAGDATLPTKESMEVEIAADQIQYESKVFAERMRSTVDFGRYTADIARRAGCFPDVGFRTFFQDYELWRAFWFGPVLPQSYRLDDGGVRGSEARARLKSTYITFFTRE